MPRAFGWLDAACRLACLGAFLRSLAVSVYKKLPMTPWWAMNQARRLQVMIRRLSLHLLFDVVTKHLYGVHKTVVPVDSGGFLLTG